MSIFVDENTKVTVQGITGKEGSFHAKSCLDYGTKILCGVTPKKGGEFIFDKPVFNTVKEAVNECKVDTSIIFVPARFATSAIKEAAEAGIKTIICITEGIPVLDMIETKKIVKMNGARLIGPNCPGIISPEKCKVGIMPSNIHRKGNIGVVSRSGTLTYEAVFQLTQQGFGQSTCIGIGGDAIIGTSFIDVLKAFQDDSETDAICMIGEIGGNCEEEAAEFIKDYVTKPIIAFIAGQSAPKGKRMGHAGAIISGNTGSAKSKIAALQNAGVCVCESPINLGSTMKTILKGI